MGYREQAEHNERDLILQKRMKEIQLVVDEQAADEGLWCVSRVSCKKDSAGAPFCLEIPIPAGEAYLQAALRRLHAVIDGEDL